MDAIVTTQVPFSSFTCNSPISLKPSAIGYQWLTIACWKNSSQTVSESFPPWKDHISHSRLARLSRWFSELPHEGTPSSPPKKKVNQIQQGFAAKNLPLLLTEQVQEYIVLQILCSPNELVTRDPPRMMPLLEPIQNYCISFCGRFMFGKFKKM